ncbi:LOW QUALITY PROTEIN: uncharacterized protein Dere_GG24163 [Drosophila erecta]|uniref:Uncharacterized protein n=1 Tax=Drosophila erecta TaxID=7220 RepID=A0A0Q5WIV5_DROER|nr:LOW QUALITY PROTEIN: uncharacterized protein Dere_GG24163 [Drosophila erecta]
MGVTNLQLCSLLTKFTALNGLNTYCFDPKTNGFRRSLELKMYCVIHLALLCAQMSFGNASKIRVSVKVLTIGGTTACCGKSCWEKAQGIRKLDRELVQMEQKYFCGRPSGPLLKYRYYMKITFVSITLLCIHLFHPIYMRRPKRPSQFYLNMGALGLLYILSIFTLKLALHPKRVVLLNVFTFDRKLTLTLLAKSTLYTIRWLQADYNKLKA